MINGFGPATAQPGSQIEVWSAVQPQNAIHSNWSGAVFSSDAEEWHATLPTPPSNVTATSTIVPAPIVFTTATYTAPTVIAKTVRYHVPAAPRGVIVMLHGSGGSSTFIERTESRYFALKAISQGYAVISPEAEESQAGDLDGDGNRRWDVRLVSSNTDLQALNALLASFYSASILPNSLPQYVMGMSNGGAMAVALGAIDDTSLLATFPRLSFKAAISYCAQARADAVAQTRTPTAWYLCANDENADVSNVNAQANSATLAANNVATTAILHPAFPIYDQRFTRVAGIGASQSAAIVAELRAAGFIAADGFITTSSADIAARFTASPASFPALGALTAGQRSDALSQIAVMRAEHEFFSDWTARSIAWFRQYP